MVDSRRLMEKDSQPRSLKVTIKLKSKTDVDSSSSAADLLNKVDGVAPNVLNDSDLSGNQAAGSQDQLKVSPPSRLEHRSGEEEETPHDNSQYQMVLYDPSVNDAIEYGTVQDSLGYQPRRVFPSIGAFTVQCANCFKWRLIPTKEKYEEIREHIMEQPFLCETVREWRPEVSCDDPPDITQDGSRLWAIDKPSIAQPPPGWQRILRIRGEGGTKFADVYYRSPSGKRLRSMVEVQKHLDEHPEYIAEGITLAKFSFQIPKPLQENYVRKRPLPARSLPMDGAGVGLGMRDSSDPLQVQPRAWVNPNLDANLEFTAPGSSTYYPGFPETHSAKKNKKIE